MQLSNKISVFYTRTIMMSDTNSPLLARIISSIDNLNNFLCRLVSWFTLLMVIVMFSVVLLRYAFNVGWIAMQESVMYLHAMVFMLGAAHTLRVNEHVRVDIFYRKMPVSQQRKVDAFGSLFLLMPVNLVILFFCFDYVADSWRLLEASPEAGGIPAVFILKSLLLLFAFTMTLQGIAEVIRNLFLAAKGDE